MYDEYYQSRLNIQQVCSFFVNGISNKNFEKGTPKERYEKNSENLYKCLENIRKKILNIDWGVIEDEKDKNMKIEDVFVDVIMYCEESQELSYEMGFRAGFTFARDIL